MPPKASRATTSDNGAPTLKSRQPNTKWSLEEVNSLIYQLLEAKDQGQTSENGFKATVWQSIANSFDDLRKKDPRVSESKWSRLKKDYKEVKFLREASGFGWDEELCVPTAEPSVWEEIKKVYSIIKLCVYFSL